MTLIKNGFLSILVLTLITLFSSCQKELLSSETTTESTDLVSRTVPEPGNTLGKPCFTIVFPVQVPWSGKRHRRGDPRMHRPAHWVWKAPGWVQLFLRDPELN